MASLKILLRRLKFILTHFCIIPTLRKRSFHLGSTEQKYCKKQKEAAEFLKIPFLRENTLCGRSLNSLRMYTRGYLHKPCRDKQEKISLFLKRSKQSFSQQNNLSTMAWCTLNLNLFSL